MLAGVAVLAVVAGCSREQPAPPGPRPALVAKAMPTDRAAPATFAGEVRARHEADVAFRVPGKVVARGVELGQRVRKGQLLARVDPADLRLQADAARAQASAAQSELALARAELDRHRGLLAQRFISQSAFDQKQAAFDAARARLAQARAELALAGNQSGYTELRADADGVVTALPVDVGQVVAAGQAVVRIARAGEREIAINVPENRLGELTDAQSTTIALWADAQRNYPGRLREVSAAVDPVTRTFAVRVAFVTAPPADLPLGATATVTVAARPGTPGMRVPLPSIYHAGDAPAVWVVDPASGKVTLRKVVLGPYRDDGALVVEGLAAGDLVVAAGVNKLVEGAVVRPVDR